MVKVRFGIKQIENEKNVQIKRTSVLKVERLS